MRRALALVVLMPVAAALRVSRRSLGAVAVGSLATFGPHNANAEMRQLRPIQFIAALGDPEASSGGGAKAWGLWRLDPGPRGVRLQGYEQLVKQGGKAPSGWFFDDKKWWLEEHGLIMEDPSPLPAGRYMVTGARKVTTELNVATDGSWTLKEGKLFDVTHLPCRSALYTPAPGGGACTPAQANGKDFPVTPGAPMPGVTGCAKQDFAVLFVLGVDDAIKEL
mmetsp:Transcript_25519/g.79601  ORF Transcript_25519/g.79601 Transcript_25519/m.79601 type:complete len:222 (+) Transcript_25519:186-851(+)